MHTSRLLNTEHTESDEEDMEFQIKTQKLKHGLTTKNLQS